MVTGLTTRERIETLLADPDAATIVPPGALLELADAIDQLRIGLAVLEHAITNDTGPRIGG